LLRVVELGLTRIYIYTYIHVCSLFLWCRVLRCSCVVLVVSCVGLFLLCVCVWDLFLFSQAVACTVPRRSWSAASSIYIYLYISLYNIYTHICTSLSLSIYVYLHVSIYIYIHMCAHVRSFFRLLYVRRRDGAGPLLQGETYIYIHMYLSLCLYICIYIYRPTYISG